MKKSRLAKQFLEELQKTPIMSAVCVKFDVSRQTISRWRKGDNDFDKKYEESLLMGVDNINDLAESKLIQHINSGELNAIKFWLTNRKREYVTPRRPIDILDNFKKDDKITGIEVRFVRTVEEVEELKKEEVDDY